jgi:hypothetical protein
LLSRAAVARLSVFDETCHDIQIKIQNVYILIKLTKVSQIC